MITVSDLPLEILGNLLISSELPSILLAEITTFGRFDHLCLHTAAVKIAVVLTHVCVSILNVSLSRVFQFSVVPLGQHTQLHEDRSQHPCDSLQTKSG